MTSAVQGIQNVPVRRQYNNAVRQLDPFDNAGRAALKSEFRATTPTLFRGPIETFRGDRGPSSSSSVGRANVTNATYTAAAEAIGVVSKGFLVAGLVTSGIQVQTASNPVREAFVQVGMWGGAISGGMLGSSAGPLGTLGGAAVGGHLGSKGGGLLYDTLFSP